MTFLPNPKPSKGRSRYPRWTLRGGAKVRLEDMTSTHLRRAIKRCEEKAQERWPSFVAECYDALGMSCEEAGFDVDAHFRTLEDPDHGWEVCLHPMHEHLVAEAERRGLKLEDET